MFNCKALPDVQQHFTQFGGDSRALAVVTSCSVVPQARTALPLLNMAAFKLISSFIIIIYVVQCLYLRNNRKEAVKTRLLVSRVCLYFSRM